jgi:transcriptional regulator with XRE-family HTH domain
LTLKQLSRGCGLSSNTISLIEHGQVAPTIETLCKIAHALGVSAGSLFEDVCDSDELCASLHSRAPQIIFEPRPVANVPEQAMPALSPQETLLNRRVMCVSGHLIYETDQVQYTLAPGDCLIFAAGHFTENAGSWRTSGCETAVAVMILPGETKDPPTIKTPGD